MGIRRIHIRIKRDVTASRGCFTRSFVYGIFTTSLNGTLDFVCKTSTFSAYEDAYIIRRSPDVPVLWFIITYLAPIQPNTSSSQGDQTCCFVCAIRASSVARVQEIFVKEIQCKTVQIVIWKRRQGPTCSPAHVG